jgi:hypothetical protein
VLSGHPLTPPTARRLNIEMTSVPAFQLLLAHLILAVLALQHLKRGQRLVILKGGGALSERRLGREGGGEERRKAESLKKCHIIVP